MAAVSGGRQGERAGPGAPSASPGRVSSDQHANRGLAGFRDPCPGPGGTASSSPSVTSTKDPRLPGSSPDPATHLPSQTGGPPAPELPPNWTDTACAWSDPGQAPRGLVPAPLSAQLRGGLFSETGCPVTTATSRHRRGRARARGSSTQPRGQGDEHRDLHTGGEPSRTEQGSGWEGEGWWERAPGARRTPLTYLAKKDFCSWGFLAFWACSISRRSMKAAVSGLGR